MATRNTQRKTCGHKSAVLSVGHLTDGILPYREQKGDDFMFAINMVDIMSAAIGLGAICLIGPMVVYGLCMAVITFRARGAAWRLEAALLLTAAATVSRRELRALGSALYERLRLGEAQERCKRLATSVTDDTRRFYANMEGGIIMFANTALNSANKLIGFAADQWTSWRLATAIVLALVGRRLGEVAHRINIAIGVTAMVMSYLITTTIEDAIDWLSDMTRGTKAALALFVGAAATNATEAITGWWIEFQEDARVFLNKTVARVTNATREAYCAYLFAIDIAEALAETIGEWWTGTAPTRRVIWRETVDGVTTAVEIVATAVMTLTSALVYGVVVGMTYAFSGITIAANWVCNKVNPIAKMLVEAFVVSARIVGETLSEMAQEDATRIAAIALRCWSGMKTIATMLKETYMVSFVIVGKSLADMVLKDANTACRIIKTPWKNFINWITRWRMVIR